MIISCQPHSLAMNNTHKLVALKFMRSHEQFSCELKSRKCLNIQTDHVVGIIAHYGSGTDEDLDFIFKVRADTMRGQGKCEGSEEDNHFPYHPFLYFPLPFPSLLLSLSAFVPLSSYSLSILSLTLYPLQICLPVRLSMSLTACLSAFLSVCLRIFMSILLFARLSVCPTVHLIAGGLPLTGACLPIGRHNKGIPGLSILSGDGGSG